MWSLINNLRQLSLCLLIATSSLGLAHTPPNVQISSQKLLLKADIGQCYYSGRVKALLGNQTLRAEQLQIIEGAEGRSFNWLARGKLAKLKFYLPNTKKIANMAEAKAIKFCSKTNTLTLSGQAKIQQAQKSLSAANILINLTSGQVQLTGHDPIKINLPNQMLP